MPGRMVVDDDEQIIANLLKQMRRLRARLATGQVRGTHDQFVAAATPQTTYTLTYIPVDGTCAMYVNGLEQTEGTDYTVNYSTAVVTFVTALTTGDQVDFRYLITDWLVARSLPAETSPNQLLAIAGNTGGAAGSTYGYSIAGNSWSSKTAVPTSLLFFASGVINNIVYIAGGDAGSGAITTVRAYDPAANTWTTKTSMPTGVQDGASAVLGGKLYVTGGSNSAGATVATVQVYDPATDSWSTVANLPTTRGSHMAAAISGKLYVAGGAIPGTSFTPTVYAYDPATNIWTAKTSMSTAVRHSSYAAVGGKMYLIGGAVSGSRIATVQVYDPVGDSWSTTTAYPLGASDQHAACEADGLLYVHGGTTNGSGTGRTVQLNVYDPATTVWTRLADSTVSNFQHALAATS